MTNNDVLLIGQGILDYFGRSEYNKIFADNNIKIGTAQKRNFGCIEELIQNAEIKIKDCGGCAGNTSMNLDALNFKHTLLVNLGNDQKSDFYKNNIFKRENIELLNCSMGGSTGVILTLEDKKGPFSPRTCIYNYGVANKINPFIVEEKINSPSLIYISLFSFVNTYSTELISYLKGRKKQKCELIFDGGGINLVESDILEELLGISSGIILNEAESNHLKKLKQKSLKNIAQNYWIISKNGPRDTVLYYKGQKLLAITPITCSNIINCVGAGDAFAAGFIKKYYETKKFNSAINYGNFIASKVIQITNFHL